jgi:hypothetical protein
LARIQDRNLAKQCEVIDTNIFVFIAARLWTLAKGQFLADLRHPTPVVYGKDHFCFLPMEAAF